MKELFEYDLAASYFYSQQGFNPLPLESWDLFSCQFQNLCNRFREIGTLKNMAAQFQWTSVPFLDTIIRHPKHVLVVTDIGLNIIHASDTMYHMNGYWPKEVIGNTPKMFQGKNTDGNTVLRIKRAIAGQSPFNTKILNYRKDGSTYTCWINCVPVRNTEGEVVNFIAHEQEVA